MMKQRLTQLLDRRARTVSVTFNGRMLVLLRTAEGDPARVASVTVAPFAHALPAASESDRRRVELVDALRRGLGAHDASGVSAVLALRQLDLKTRFSRLPATDDSEIEQMADFEISKAIPFDDRPHQKRFTTLRRHGIEGADVMMYAVDSGVLEDYVRAFHRVRLPLERTVATGLALHELSRRFPPVFADDDPAAAELGDATAPRLLLYLGIDRADLVLLSGGIPIFIRSATAPALTRLQSKLQMGNITLQLADVGRLDLDRILPALGEIAERNRHLAADEPEVETESITGVWMGLPDQAVVDWVSRIVREVRKTLEFARTEAALDSIRRIDLCGPGSLVRHLPERLAAELRTPVVMMADEAGRAFEGASLRIVAAVTGGEAAGSPAAAAPPADGVEAAFCRELALPALGALLYHAAGSPATDDLTPDWYHREQDATTRRRSLARSGVLAAILLVVAVFYLALDAHHRTNYLDALREDNARMEPIAAQLASKKEKLEIVRRVVADKYSALAVLELLSSLEVIREGRAKLRNVQFVRGGELVLSGNAKAIGDILQLERALKSHGDFFAAVINRGQGPTTLNGKEIYEFNFQCNLRDVIVRDAPALPSGPGDGSRTVIRSASR